MSEALLEHGAIFADRYKVIRHIASGKVGAVYEVAHLTTERRCALKVLLPDYVGNEEWQKRFAQEAKVSAQIQSEFIVDVLDAGSADDGNVAFLVMELLNGEEMRKRLERVNRFSPDQALIYLKQLSIALDKTHAANIVHRDLKPDNLFLTEREDGSPVCKILDFGVAKVLLEGGGGAKGTRNLGTPIYMAPEQFRSGEGLGPAADIFALGMLSYTMMVGQHYWKQDLEAAPNAMAFLGKAIHGPKDPALPRAAKAGVSLPPAYDEWFARATAADYGERFSTAGQAVKALAEVLASKPAPASKPQAIPHASPKDTATLSAEQMRQIKETASLPFSPPPNEPVPACSAATRSAVGPGSTKRTSKITAEQLREIKATAAVPLAEANAPSTEASTTPVVLTETSTTIETMRARLPQGPCMVIIAKANCDLVPDGCATIRANCEALCSDQLHSQNGSLRYPLDHVGYKRRADVMLNGHGRAPGGPHHSLQIRFAFGHQGNRFERSAVLWGNRAWQRTPAGVVVSPPQPFEELPLIYERAFGGADYEANPVGLGFGGRPSSDGVAWLPNLEDPASPITDPRQTPEPVCFAPRYPGWDPELAPLLAPTGQQEVEQRYPEAFPWDKLQVAPPAQQLDPLRGDEPYECQGMHTQLPYLRGQLPGVSMRVFAARTSPSSDRSGEPVEEIAMRLDTVLFDIDSMSLTLLWRGAATVQSPTDTSIRAVLAIAEPIGGSHMTAAAAQIKLAGVWGRMEGGPRSGPTTGAPTVTAWRFS